MSETDASPASLEEQMPDEGMRTWISLLLLFHLAALLIALLSNAGPVSALRNQLGEVPGVQSYLQLLQMDLAYNYHYTYGLEADDDHRVEIEVNWTGESNPEAQVLEFPDPHATPPARYRRQRNLVSLLARLVLQENDQRKHTLPHAVAKSLLLENGITEGTHRLRCVRIASQLMPQATSADPEQRDPLSDRYTRVIYEADLAFNGPQLLLNEVRSELETAPVTESEGDAGGQTETTGENP